MASTYPVNLLVAKNSVSFLLPNNPIFIPNSTRPSFFALTQLQAKLAKVSLRPFFDVMFKPRIILAPVLNFDLLQVSWFPMEADEAANEQLGAVFGRFA